MKKLFSIIMCCTLTFMMSFTAFAAENASSNVGQKIVVNEYDLAKQLANKSVKTLSQNGYSTNEIRDIKNYQDVYCEHIEKLNTLNDEALLENGYSEDQIEIIRNFKGTDAEMARLGATLTLTAEPQNFTYKNGDLTTGKITYSWEWNSVPAFKMQDMVAVSWNDWVVTNDKSTVKYYNTNTGKLYKSLSATYSEDGNGTQGSGHKFKVAIEDNAYYAKMGNGTFTIKSDVFAQKNCYFYLEYGHSQVSPKINFSVGTGGASASIDFTLGAVAADFYKGNYEFPRQ